MQREFDEISERIRMSYEDFLLAMRTAADIYELLQEEKQAQPRS